MTNFVVLNSFYCYKSTVMKFVSSVSRSHLRLMTGVVAAEHIVRWKMAVLGKPFVIQCLSHSVALLPVEALLCSFHAGAPEITERWKPHVCSTSPWFCRERERDVSCDVFISEYRWDW